MIGGYKPPPKCCPPKRSLSQNSYPCETGLRLVFGFVCSSPGGKQAFRRSTAPGSGRRDAFSSESSVHFFCTAWIAAKGFYCDIIICCYRSTKLAKGTQFITPGVTDGLRRLDYLSEEHVGLPLGSWQDTGGDTVDMYIGGMSILPPKKAHLPLEIPSKLPSIVPLRCNTQQACFCLGESPHPFVAPLRPRLGIAGMSPARSLNDAGMKRLEWFHFFRQAHFGRFPFSYPLRQFKTRLLFLGDKGPVKDNRRIEAGVPYPVGPLSMFQTLKGTGLSIFGRGKSSFGLHPPPPPQNHTFTILRLWTGKNYGSGGLSLWSYGVVFKMGGFLLVSLQLPRNSANLQ